MKAPQQQSGANQQHQGDGDFEGHECIAGTAGAAPLRSSAAGLAEVGVDAADRRVKRRRKAAEHTGDERQEQGEEQHAAVERHRLDAWQIAGTDAHQPAKGPPRDHGADGCTGRRQHD